MTETVTHRRGDTRERIQDVALERFTAHGYAQTSLREIAEDLGFTKAAVYYHFKTKEEILDSLLEQVVAEIDELATWLQNGPATRERRLEMIDRLVDVTRGLSGSVLRCVQQNEVALQQLSSTTELIHQLKQRLWDSSLPADASTEDKLRMRMAVMTVLIATKVDSDLGGSATDRAAAARAVANLLVP
jgi:AcrR family transcriptional regulator